MPNFNIRMDDALVAKLDEIAKRERVGRSYLIRVAVARMLGEFEVIEGRPDIVRGVELRLAALEAGLENLLKSSNK